MIPKVIHYCWFGKGKMPSLAERCIASWRSILPDYEIKCWNEDNFDISSNRYVNEAYIARKYAFVADYVRLYALYNEGGIYMDSDVEVIKRIDKFLSLPAFTGFETTGGCITGIMGSEAHGQWVKDLLDEYEDRVFVNPDGTYNITTNVKYTMDLMRAKGIQIGKKDSESGDDSYVKIFPFYYFCPKPVTGGKYEVTGDTYTVHHFAGSWLSPKQRLVMWTVEHFGLWPGRVVSLLWNNPLKIVPRVLRFVQVGK